MASLDNDTLADVHTTPAEARTEEQTSAAKAVGGPVVDGAAETDGGKLVLSGPSSTVSAHASTLATTSNPNGTVTVAHPKKFNAVNINKKFLEKTGSAAPAAQPAAHTPAKTSGLALSSKPVQQTSASHSRLVTTKLTAGPSGINSPGPGWSRPSSTAPQHSSTAIETPLVPQVTPAASGAPQLPVAGKVIQPQPRAAAPVVAASDASSKLVWRTQRPAVSTVADLKAQTEFPTAAEATQVTRSSPSVPQKEVEDPNFAKRQALQQQVDAFRGVHLDPNAHHWDEMEGDDDDFLDGVVEFGDGKQYKVEPAQPTSDQTEPTGTRKESDGVTNQDSRFADDFDRSWPRSATSSNLPNQRDLPPHTGATPSGRTLFNERSNRLEHVSPTAGSHREGPPHLGGHRDNRSSPIERRFSNDGSVHTPSQGFQLLQKSLDTPPYRSRGARPGGSHDDSRQDGYPTLPRPPLSAGSQSSFSARDTLPPSVARSPSSTGRNRDGAADFPARRLSNMGPPPIPQERHPPPHLAHGMPTMARSPSVASTRRDSVSSNDHRAGFTLPSSRAPPPQSPIIDAKNVVATPEYEEVSKAAMHSAAEQARRRRQQEEEEREKTKERARQKAAELEAKSNQSKQADATSTPAIPPAISEKDVLEVIVEAVKGEQPALAPPPLQRPPSIRGSTRPPNPTSKPALNMDGVTGRKGGVGITSPGLTGSSPAQEASSWRRRTSISHESPSNHPPSGVRASGAEPKPHIAASVEPFSVNADEVLEVIDFTDMDRLVSGGDEKDAKIPLSSHSSQHPAATGASKINRPVASDFFHEENPARPPVTPSRTETTSWRRKAPDAAVEPPVATENVAEPQRLHLVAPTHRETPLSPRSSFGHDLPARPLALGSTSPTMSRQPSHHGIPRSPRASGFREAPMSALDDALSRIKGAIDGMQAKEANLHASRSPDGPSQESLVSTPLLKAVELVPVVDAGLPRWLPPALRSRSGAPHAHAEEFHFTSSERPATPKPAWNTFAIKLPKEHPVLPPLPKKQEHGMKYDTSTFRWDVLTWNPPVRGMGRKDLSVNDVLFELPPLNRGTPRYTVALPLSSISLPPTGKETSSDDGMKVNLPSVQGSNKQAVSQTVGALPVNGAGTWHKARGSSDGRTLAPHVGDASLNTVSRSPPPPPPSGQGNPSVSGATPPGSDVGKGTPTTPAKSPALRWSGLPPPSISEVATPLISEQSNEVANSPSQLNLSESGPGVEVSNAILSKGSAARAPDPEHLKAVWSQASDKADISASNSLEGIADDLTALQPFTIQDVKSDGGTPPLPPPTGTLRMSLSEVTRAFQQVPASSNPSTEPAPASTPPPSSAPSSQPMRRPSYGPASVPSPHMRPAYAHYPVVSSPGPSIVYPQMVPSPGPRPMQLPGTPQQYPQPMWIPVPPGSAPPTPAGMVRTLSSPYAAPMMAYSPSGHPPHMYPVGASPGGYMHHAPHPSPGGPQSGQMRPVPMLSPMMQHAAMPMYAGSPVLVHAQPYPSAMTPGQLPRQALPPTPRAGVPPLPYGQVPQSPYHRPW